MVDLVLLHSAWGKSLNQEVRLTEIPLQDCTFVTSMWLLDWYHSKDLDQGGEDKTKEGSIPGFSLI
jgi:hypothetical protein